MDLDMSAAFVAVSVGSSVVVVEIFSVSVTTLEAVFANVGTDSVFVAIDGDVLIGACVSKVDISGWVDDMAVNCCVVVVVVEVVVCMALDVVVVDVVVLVVEDIVVLDEADSDISQIFNESSVIPSIRKFMNI